MMRFFRALGRALWLTMRGQTLTPARYRPLERWNAAGLRLVAQVYAAAERERIELDALQLKLDGRPTSLARSLQMVRHNLVNEYPRLLRLDDPYSMTVVQSSNLNDQYRVAQFLEAELAGAADLRQALDDLNEHLRELPQIEPPVA